MVKEVVIDPDYGWVNEDMLTHVHPLPHEDWACADLLFFETPAGGAVFSVGSRTWAGAVPIPGTLRTLTTNVLKRFMDPAPFTLRGLRSESEPGPLERWPTRRSAAVLAFGFMLGRVRPDSSTGIMGLCPKPHLVRRAPSRDGPSPWTS